MIYKDWSKKIEAEIEKRRERRSSRERDLKPREVPEYMSESNHE